MYLHEGDRVKLIADKSPSLAKGAKGTVISYQLSKMYAVKFDNGVLEIVHESHLAQKQASNFGKTNIGDTTERS